MRATGDSIIEAGARLLSRDRSASMGEVAAATGVSRATLHRAFPSREVLVEAIIERACERALDVFRGARTGEGTVPEALRRLAEGLIPIAHFWVIAVNEPMIGTVPRLAKGVAELEDHLVGLIRRGQDEGTLRQDLSPRWMAYFVGLSVVTAHEAVVDGVLAPRDAVDTLIDSTLNGLGRCGQ
ncbi:MAG: TetR/AcrR family transcriptional regulator [Nocardioides sp.]